MQLNIDDLANRIADTLVSRNSPHKEWEEYLPIQIDHEAKTVSAYLLEEINMPPLYSRLCNILLTYSKEYTTILYINNGGGFESSATMVMDAISRSKMKVIAHLSGLVASAATLITMACDEIIVAPNLMFMIHESSFEGSGGKFSDMKTFQTFYDKHTKQMSIDVYGGFITTKEIEEMHRGKELWFGSAEVLRRWSLKTGLSKPKRGRPSRKES